MVFERQNLITQIREWIERLDRAMAAEIILDRLDSAKAGENFTRDLLKLVYGWDLKNANFSVKNQDSYDLSSEDGELAIQVTISTGAAKIRKTLKTFVPNHRKDFKRLVFFYHTESRQDRRRRAQKGNQDGHQCRKNSDAHKEEPTSRQALSPDQV